MAQETGQEAASMTLFQRTPNLALPMRQRKLTKEEQDKAKEGYPQTFKDRMQTFAGFAFDFADKNTFDDSDEERQKFYEDLWDKGKFTSTAADMFHIILIDCRRLPLLACDLQGYVV